MSWDPSGQKLLAVADGEPYGVVLDGKSGERLCSIDVKGRIKHAMWHPNGSQIITGNGDKSVRIHDAESGNLRQVQPAVSRPFEMCRLFIHQGEQELPVV